MRKIISKSEAETVRLGQELGQICNGGEVFALEGELGSGKTYLAKGIALGLGVKDTINSPTFNIMKIYQTRRKDIKYFSHLDAYRLNRHSKLENIGIDEYLFKNDSVCAVEWFPNIFAEVKGKKLKIIKLKLINKTKRLIKIY